MARTAVIVLILGVCLPEVLLAGVVLKAGEIDSGKVHVGAFAEVVYGKGERDPISGEWEKLVTARGYIKAVDAEGLTLGGSFRKKRIAFARIQKLLLAASSREMAKLRKAADMELSLARTDARDWRSEGRPRIREIHKSGNTASTPGMEEVGPSVINRRTGFTVGDKGPACCFKRRIFILLRIACRKGDLCVHRAHWIFPGSTVWQGSRGRLRGGRLREGEAGSGLGAVGEAGHGKRIYQGRGRGAFDPCQGEAPLHSTRIQKLLLAKSSRDMARLRKTTDMELPFA